MDPTQNTQQEIYRLVKENNRLLHKMRRSAVIGGIIKFLLYTGLFIVLPFWLYMTYFAPIVESMVNAVEQVQGTGAKTQSQLENLQNVLSQFDLSQYFGR